VTAEQCPSCGGEWVDGRIAMPIVGALRFVYRLGTNEVATEVAARMCADCGAVQLRARDPQAIVRAERAAANGRPAKPWSLFSRNDQET
jgi:Zn-finger nucleic acid-binding protein